MTTFWARMLIFNECKNPGKFSTGLPEEAAMYFDELMERYSTTTTPSVFNAEVINCTILNDPSTYCVLGNIGAVNNPEGAVRNFDVVKYIKATTYICNEVYDNTFIVHLASLIGEEYAGLDSSISSLIKHGKPSIEDLKLIRSYLYDTKYLPTKKGTHRDATGMYDLVDYYIRHIENEKAFAEWQKKQSKNDTNLTM